MFCLRYMIVLWGFPLLLPIRVLRPTVGAASTTVATASWDKTVRLWNTYSGGSGATDILQHAHEVLAVAMHPTGRCLAAATLNGEISFWDTQEAALSGVIDVRSPHPLAHHRALK